MSAQEEKVEEALRGPLFMLGGVIAGLVGERTLGILFLAAGVLFGLLHASSARKR